MTTFESTEAIRGPQTTFWPKSYFDDFHSAQWGGRWVGGQLATFPNCPGTKFPEAVHGQSVLSQKMKNFRWKMAESFRSCDGGPVIISGNGKSWVLAFGGQTVKGKLFQINQTQPQALPNNQQKHYRPPFNQQNPSGAFPKASDRHLKNPRFWRFSLSPMAELKSAQRKLLPDIF